MPAEWAPHRATWLVWPHNRSDWPGKIGPVNWCFVELVRQLSAAEVEIEKGRLSTFEEDPVASF